MFGLEDELHEELMKARAKLDAVRTYCEDRLEKLQPTPFESPTNASIRAYKNVLELLKKEEG